MGRLIRLLEDGECVGEVDLETSDAWYDGASDYVAHVIEKVDDGITEFEPGRPVESGRPVPAERERTGASLQEYVENSIDGEVEYEVVER